jgi:hypothetical protein
VEVLRPDQKIELLKSGSTNKALLPVDALLIMSIINHRYKQTRKMTNIIKSLHIERESPCILQ